VADNKPKLSKFLRIGFVLAGIVSISQLGYMIFIAIDRVSSGHGLETFGTFWFTEDSWLGFLIALAATVVALLVALVFRIREHLSWRSLERKYAPRE
jgi:hypothetical protein